MREPHAPRGTACHGNPHRATYKIPSRHARSDTRGRPRPRRTGGSTTATRSHTASVSTRIDHPSTPGSSTSIDIRHQARGTLYPTRPGY